MQMVSRCSVSDDRLNQTAVIHYEVMTANMIWISYFTEKLRHWHGFINDELTYNRNNWTDFFLSFEFKDELKSEEGYYKWFPWCQKIAK